MHHNYFQNASRQKVTQSCRQYFMNFSPLFVLCHILTFLNVFYFWKNFGTSLNLSDFMDFLSGKAGVLVWKQSCKDNYSWERFSWVQVTRSYVRLRGDTAYFSPSLSIFLWVNALYTTQKYVFETRGEREGWLSGMCAGQNCEQCLWICLL